ncbi:hypothetical protein BRD00_07470 [Halobacteriales archaeon QS_8_69_26]|nr:MAG: hypothetical protein BRD00_07470 [Halobacteriales archaeon QS_8_69_26]
MVDALIVSQAVVNGILLGCLFAAMGAGFSLMFGVLRVFNLVYGDQVVLGSYVAYWLMTLYGVSFPVAFAVAVGVGIASGAVLYYTIIKWMLQAPVFNQIVITFGALILVENVFALLWDPTPRTFTSPLSLESVAFGPFTVSLVRLLVGVGGVILIAALYLFLTRTKYGQAVYATSINEQASLVVGIRTERVKSVAFVLGSAMAGAAGAMTLFVMSFGPFSGLDFLITVLVAVILGGMGSIVGTLVGGILLGVVVNVGNIFVPGALTPWLEFGLLIVVLAVRPTGIMGIRGLEEV